jgi:peptide/nickel transport system substrate-binding protein
MGATTPSRLLVAGLAAAISLAVGCGRGGREPPLRVGLYAGPLSRDPHLVREYLTFGVLAGVYEGLVDLDRALAPRPRLAESWQSPDKQTWVFRIRRGVRFHDGRPLTARDVVFSLDRARRGAGSEYAGYLAAIDTIRSLDSHAVEVRTREPAGLLLHKLASVLIVPDGSPAVIHDAIGTGPYRLAGAGHGLVLTAHPGYWGPPPPEPEIVLVVTPDAAESRRLLVTGALDILWRVAPSELRLVEEAPGCRIVAQPSFAVEVLQMRVSASPFSDLRVRQAVNLALDREALVGTIGHGRGSPASQLVGRGVLGFDPKRPPARPDLEAARALLAEAGVGGGFDVELEFREGRDAAPIQAQLGAVGIRVTLRPRPWGQLVARLQAGETAFYYGAYAAETGDAGDVLRGVLGGEPYGGGRWLGYSSEELDRLLTAADRAQSVAARRALLQGAMAVALRDLPLVPLIIPEDLYGIRSNIDWTPRPDGRFDARELRRTRARWR